MNYRFADITQHLPTMSPVAIHCDGITSPKQPGLAIIKPILCPQGPKTLLKALQHMCGVVQALNTVAGASSDCHCADVDNVTHAEQWPEGPSCAADAGMVCWASLGQPKHNTAAAAAESAAEAGVKVW
jgi:hypothetical protein